MEEAEKRKERLRANRTDAAQSEISSHQLGYSPAHLLNPLAQTSAVPPTGERRLAPGSRFDFYTDPMSAFSGGRGIHPPANSSSPTPPLSSPSSGGRGSPQNPFPSYQFQHQSFSSHHTSYNSLMPVPQYGQWRSPPGTARPFSNHNRPIGSTYVHDFARNASRGIIGSNPRGYRGAGRPVYNYGRGDGNWRSGSYGRGRGRGGTGEPGSARERPELYSHKMMVMNPWLGLEPVVGRIFMPPAMKMTSNSPNSWLPSSIRTKKVKVQETISGTRSQISLAQSIALAFEEAAKEEGGV